MMKKVIWLGFMILVMFFSSDRPAQSLEPAGELRIGALTLYDQTLHPNWGSVFRKKYLEPMYDHLIGVDKNGKFDPTQSIATKWEAAPNLMSWTFYIREGVKFHNGDPVTIEDVKYTIEEGSSKKNLYARSDFEAKVDRVEAVPPNKVVVHLKSPWPTILYHLSPLSGGEGMIQPKKYLQEKGDDYFKKNPVGTGPYKFFEWKEGVHIKYVAQNAHWRVGVPKYKYLTFKLIPEDGTRAAALRAGEVDVIEISLAMLKGLRDSGFTIQQKTDSLQLGLMFIQSYRPDFPTHYPKVRQALIYAVNKDEILKQILQGQGERIGHTVPMLTWSIEYKPYPLIPYDPKNARRLLAEAGYPGGFSIYLYSFQSHLPELKIINEAVAGYWEDIGVKVKILEMDYSAFRAIYSKHKEPAGPSVFLLDYPNRPVYSWRTLYHSTAMFSHVKDPQADRMIEELEKQRTLEGYIASAQKLEDYALANFFSAGICTTHGLLALGKNIPKWELGKGLSSFRWEYMGEK